VKEFKGFPLIPADSPGQVPTPDQTTVTWTANRLVIQSHAQMLVEQKGADGSKEANEFLVGAWRDEIDELEREAYARGWREVFREDLKDTNRKYTYWKVENGALREVTATFHNGPLTTYPSVKVTDDWADVTYNFVELGPVAMGQDFPLCVPTVPADPAAKASKSGTKEETYSISCKADDFTGPRPYWQLPRVAGWNIVRGPDPKSHVALYQKLDRFAEVTASGGKVKVTLVGASRQKTLLKQFPALAENERVHPLTTSGLIYQGHYLPPPFRLTVKGQQVFANDTPIWPSPDSGKITPEAALDRFTHPKAWSPLKLIPSSGAWMPLRSADLTQDKMAAQIAKIVNDKAGTENDKVAKLSKLGILNHVPDDALHEIVRNWKGPAASTPAPSKPSVTPASTTPTSNAPKTP
jgi:hypothetical protein